MGRSVDIFFRAFDQTAAACKSVVQNIKGTAAGVQGTAGGGGEDKEGGGVLSAAHWLKVGMKIHIFAKAAEVSLGIFTAALAAAKGKWDEFHDALSNTPVLGEFFKLGMQVRNQFTHEYEQDEKDARKETGRAKHFGAQVASTAGWNKKVQDMDFEASLVGVDKWTGERMKIQRELDQTAASARSDFKADLISAITANKVIASANADARKKWQDVRDRENTEKITAAGAPLEKQMEEYDKANAAAKTSMNERVLGTARGMMGMRNNIGAEDRGFLSTVPSEYKPVGDTAADMKALLLAATKQVVEQDTQTGVLRNILAELQHVPLDTTAAF